MKSFSGILLALFVAIHCVVAHRRKNDNIVKPKFVDVSKAIPDGEYYIFAQHSGLVLQSDPCLSTGPSQPRIMQYQLTGDKSQKYLIRQTEEENGYYYIKSLLNGKYWDIGGSTFDDHESLTEFRFHGKENQQFRFDPIADSNGLYRIVARHSNKVIDVHFNSKENGANLVQHNYNGGDNQKFRLIAAKQF